MRNRGKLLTVLVGVVVVIIVVVLLTRGGEESSAAGPVDQSTSTTFPSRGELADQQALLDEAADAWRDVRDEGDRPEGVIQVLFAGEVPGEDLPVRDGDQDGDLNVVVLTSRDLVVSAIELGNGTWEVGSPIVVPRTSRDLQALIPTGDAGYLLNAETFDGGLVPAVELPRPREDGDAGDDLTEDERTPRRFDIDTSDALWQPTQIISGRYAVRIPAAVVEGYGGQAWVGVGTGNSDVVMQTETANGGAAADDPLWEQLTSPDDSAAVVAAVERAAEAADVVDQNGRYAGWQAKIRLWSLGGADVQVPDGARRVAAVGLGIGSDNGADVVTMGFLDPESGVTDELLLGERPGESDPGMPLAAAWVLYDSQAILFYASVDLTLDLRVGDESVATPGPVGAYLPASSGTEAAELPTTLLGSDSTGQRYTSFPVGRVVASS